MTKSEIENIRNNGEVKMALDQTGNKKQEFKVVANTRDKISIATYLIILLGLALLHYIVKLDLFLNLDFFNNFLPQELQITDKLIEGAMTVVLILVIARVLKVVFINRIEDTASRFNLIRVLNLMVGIILFFLIVSVLFANWYTAVVSLGLISLILGFALQTPITSFIGWIYIVIRKPYKVGDRIKMEDATGDVIDVGYFDTTLWESYGDVFSTDHPSGRIIRIPNSKILDTPVYNYSWALFPYIWDEIKLFVAFQSDLQFIAASMERIAEEELGHDIQEKTRIYHEILKETPVDSEQLINKPVVSFRVNENVWVEARLHYLVSPQHSGKIKTAIIKKMIKELNHYQDKVMFPKGDSR